MLARIRKAMDEKDQGFTLIELLVVMIIIGILAAIAIPVFLNQRKKARDTSTKADVSTVGKEIATYYVDGAGTLSVAVAAGVGTPSDGAGGYTTDLKLSNRTPPKNHRVYSQAAAAGVATLSDGAGGYTTDIKLSNGTALKTNVVYSNAAAQDSTWCVALTNAAGDKKDYQYSAKNGLTQGTCAAGTF